MVYNITEAGLKAIVSSPWYLNYISYGSDAMKIYLEDPQAFGGTEEQEKLVVGGEVRILDIFFESELFVTCIVCSSRMTLSSLMHPSGSLNRDVL